MKVKVYFNLHKKVFSVVDNKTKKVVRYSNGLSLNDATFKVSKAGRERVLKERRKNVHAYVIGEDDLNYCIPSDATEVTYNPYLYNSFVEKDTKKPISKAYKVFLRVDNKRAKLYALKPEESYAS